MELLRARRRYSNPKSDSRVAESLKRVSQYKRGAVSYIHRRSRLRLKQKENPPLSYRTPFASFQCYRRLPVTCES